MSGESIGMSTARVVTDRPARYAKQLFSHFGRDTNGTWNTEEGRGTFAFIGEGRESENPKKAFDGRMNVSVVAAEATLLIHLEGPDPLIERFEEVVGSHLVRFGVKDQLSVTWRRGDGSKGTSQTS